MTLYHSLVIGIFTLFVFVLPASDSRDLTATVGIQTASNAALAQDDRARDDSETATDDEQPAADEQPEPADETPEEPAEEPDDEPAADSDDEPADESGDQPADEPEEEPSADSDDEPAEKPEDEPADESGDQPADEPEDEPAAESDDEPAEEPEDEPAADSDDQPADEPEDEPADADAPEDKPDDSDAEPSDSSEAEKTFDALFGEWKDLIAHLRELRLKWVATKPADRKPIEEEYYGLVRKGEELEPKVTAGAEAAFLAAPNKNEEVADFLAQLVQADINRDNYEGAFRLAKVLIDNMHENERLPGLAGFAAFNSNDFDAAENYFQMAKAAGELEGEYESYLDMVSQYQKAWQREQELREAEASADDLPRVRLKTSKGKIVIELFENEAPNTVANFVNLVEKGFYNDTVFHRVLPGFMAQGGDPKGTGMGGPGYRIACECYQENHRLHFRGSLSMAKSAERDTGGSQFFLMFRPSGPLMPRIQRADLDGKHTVFGRIIEGIEVLAMIQRIDPQKEEGRVTPDKIIEATVERKRDHAYEPMKVASDEESDEESEE